MLFHFTKVITLLQIINDNSLLPGFNGTISLTRNPNHFYIQKLYGFDACLVLDRNKLKNNYRIDLRYGWISTYNKSNNQEEIGNNLYKHYQAQHGITTDKWFLFQIAKNHGRESEEILKKPIKNLRKYIVEIVINNKKFENLFLHYGRANNISISSAKFNYDKSWFSTRVKL